MKAGKTAYTAPPKRFGDGVFHVMLIRRRTCSRYRLARILLALETGQHVDLPGVEWITCTAYQWIPDDPNASCNDLDGEVVERGRVEGGNGVVFCCLFCSAQCFGSHILFFLFVIPARVLPQAVRYFGRPHDERSNSSTTSTKQKSE